MLQVAAVATIAIAAFASVNAQLPVQSGPATTSLDVDGALSAQLAWLASSRAPPVGSNTAAIISQGSVLIGTATGGPDFLAQSSAPFQSPSSQQTSLHTVSLLANGCFIDTQMRFGVAAMAPTVPFVCPPAGLGSRFISVTRGPNFAGGVTDVGALVLFGPLGSGERCAVIRGPFTAMAALQRMYPASAVSIPRVAVPFGEDLCALDAAGVLHCWADLPAAWTTAAPRWQPTAPSAAARPASLCLDVTGNATFLRPSPRLCPRAAAATASAAAAGNLVGAAADCAAPVVLASFALSPCSPYTTGTYITGVRAADNLPVAWLVGSDTWEDDLPKGSLAALPTGLFNVSGAPIATDPRLPPLWRCTDPVGQRVFMGRAADGSGYWEEPETRLQGVSGLAVLPRRGLNATAARLAPTAALYSFTRGFITQDWGTSVSTACGPFAPFTASLLAEGVAGNNDRNDISAGVRWTDATLQLPGQEMSHLLPASPVAVAHLLMAPGADMLCASFAPTAASHAGTGYDPTWEVKCAGPTNDAIRRNYHAVTHTLYTLATETDDTSSRCMRTPPAALAVSRSTFASAAPTFVSTRSNTGTAVRPCTGCAVFSGYAALPAYRGGAYITPTVIIPTAAPLRNVTAIALQPSAGAFVCAVTAPSGILQCSSNAQSRVPGFVADRPPAETPCALVAVTETAVCATVAANGWLWCFADDIAPLSAALSAAGLPTTVPPGANATRAVLVQVNVTAVAASEAIVCFVYNAAATAGLFGCLGPTSNRVLVAAVAGITAAGMPGGLASLADWAASRGGSATVVPLRSVSVGVDHACVLAVTGRAWCWGTEPTSAFGGGAVSDLNSDNSRYLLITAGGNSSCGQLLDGRLRCFGLLAAYIQDAQRGPVVADNTSVLGGGGDPLLSIMLAGVRVQVAADRGNDANCSCERLPNLASGDSDESWTAMAPCATLAGALTAAARTINATADTTPSVQIWVRGIVLAAAASNATLVLPRGVALLQVRGILNTGATIAFPPCTQLAAASEGAAILTPAACITATDFVLPGFVVRDLTMRPANAASLPTLTAVGSGQHCSSVIASAILTRLVNVSFEGWNCSGALVSLRAPASVADGAFAAAQSYVPSYDSGARQASAIAGGLTAEVVGARFDRCNAPAGIVGSTLPGIRIAGVFANTSTFESVILVDQALYSRVDNIQADRLVTYLQVNASVAQSISSVAASTFLPGSAVCGGLVRVNNVANAHITALSVRGLRMPIGVTGGGALCVTDVDHAGTRPGRPRVLSAVADGVVVEDCSIGGSGCAVYAGLERSLSAVVAVSSVAVSRSAVSGDGAGIFVSTPTAAIDNVTCKDTLSSGGRGGGCIAADGCASLSISALIAERSVALRAGGAVWVRAGSSLGAVSIRSAELTDTAALTSDGGAVNAVDAVFVTVSAVACTRTSAPRGSGGCAAVTLAAARGSSRTSSFDIRRTTARECSAAYRGGALAFAVGVVPGDSSTLSVSLTMLISNVVGSALCSQPLLFHASRIASRAPPGEPALWWNATLLALLNGTAVRSGAAADQTCVPPDDADVGGGGLAVVYVRGRVDSPVDSSAGSVLTDGVAGPRVGLADVLMEGNIAGAVGDALGRGGGIIITRSETAPSLALLSMRRVALVRNFAAGSGGGLAMRSTLASASNVSVISCTAAAGHGGGIYAADAALTAVPSFVLAHNRAESGSGGGAALSSCILGGLQLLGGMRPYLAPSVSATPSVTPSASGFVTVTPTQTSSVTVSVISSKSPGGTATPTLSSTQTSTRTVTRSLSSTGTAAATVSPSRTPSATALPRPGETAVRADVLTDALNRWLVSDAISIVNNSAAVTGGGLALMSCDAVIGGAILLRNSADEGGGASTAGSGSLHLCAALFALNRAVSAGGGLALVDATRESHLCDEAGCARYLLLTSAAGSSGFSSSDSGGTVAVPRLPFRLLVAALTAQARRAFSSVGIGDAVLEPAGLALPRLQIDLLRGAVPPAPRQQSAEAVWSGLQEAAEAAAADMLASAASAAAAANLSGILSSVVAAALPGAGDAANCAWAANAVRGAGADVSIRSASSASAVAAAGQPVTYLRKALFYAGTAGAAGGAIFVAAAPVSLTALDIVAPLAGSIYACGVVAGGANVSSTTSSSASSNTPGNTTMPACNASLTASSSDVVSDNQFAGFGGAIALLQPVYAELVAVRCISPAARFGGMLWVEPFEPVALAAASVSIGAAIDTAEISASAAAKASSLSRLDSRVLSGAVRVGTARALQAAAALAAGRPNAALPAAPLDGRLLAGAWSVSNSTSAAGGASLFVHGALRNASASAVSELVDALGDGNLPPLAASGPLPRRPASARAASLPVGVLVASSLPLSADAGAVQLVSLVPAPGPLAVLHLRDALNETAAWDDDTVCVVSVVSSGGSSGTDGAQGSSSLALMFSPRYVAQAGVVTLAPFGIASAPGSSGQVRVSCSVKLGDVAYSLTTLITTVMTVRVRLQMDAVAAAAPLGLVASAAPVPTLQPFCNRSEAAESKPSAFTRPAPGSRVLRPVLLPVVAGSPVWEPDWLVRLTLTDAAGNPVAPPAVLPCALRVQAAIDATSGGAVSAALVALAPQATTVVDLAGSSATAPIAIVGAAGALVNVSAACRWPSGETVDSAAPLLVETASLQLAWVVGIASSVSSLSGKNSTVPNSAASACSDWTVTCGGDNAQAGCPLSLQDASSGGADNLPASFASWAAEPAWSLNVTSVVGRQPATGSRALSQLLGVRADVLNAGTAFDAAFPRPTGTTASVLIVATPPGVSNAATTPSLLDAAAWASDWSRSAVAALAPAALPSSADGLQLLPLRPTPAFILLALHAALPTPLAFHAGNGVCTAALVPAQSAGQLPALSAIVGTANSQLVGGGVVWSSLGVTALSIGDDTAAQLRVACALSGGEAEASARVPLRVPSLQAVIASAPPSLISPSGVDAVAPLLQPLVYALIARRAGCGAGSNAVAGAAPGQEGACETMNSSAALADTSVSAVLRSVDAKVSCSLACEPVSGSVAAQPCTLSGRTSAVLDVSGTQALGATASFPAFGLSEVARFRNTSCFSAACTWLDGQRVFTPAVCTAQPAATVVWCDSPGADCGEEAPDNGPPAVTVANEPLAPFAMAVRTSPAGGLAALQLAETALKCVLAASAGSDLGSLIIRDGEAVVDPRSGLVIMAGAMLQLTPAQAAALDSSGVLNVQLSASCTAFGRPFASALPRSIRLPQLQASWAAPPPAVVLPAAATVALPLEPTVRVALADAANASAVVDVAGSCTVSIVQRWLPPDPVAAGAPLGALDFGTNDTTAGAGTFALLLGSTTRPLFRGVVAFPDLALAASMGTVVTLRASCVRAQGGSVASSEWNVSVAHAAVSWGRFPRLVLSGRRVPVPLHVSWRSISAEVAASKGWRWTCDNIVGSEPGSSGSAGAVASANDTACTSSSGSPVPSGRQLPPDMLAVTIVQRVSCSLALEDVSPEPVEAAALAVQFSSLAVSANTSFPGTGAVGLVVDVSGAGGRLMRLQPVCTTGGHTFRAPARVATLATVTIAPLEPIPGVWLPSDGSAVTLIAPAPRLQLIAADGSIPDTRGAICTASTSAAIGRGAAAEPYLQTLLSTVALGRAANGSAAAALVISDATAQSLATRWPANMSVSLPGSPINGYYNSPGAGSLDPVLIDSLAIRAEFGGFVALRLGCVRGNKDATLPLLVLLRIARLASTWGITPPSVASPGAIFAVSILLFDADANGIGGSNSTAGRNDASSGNASQLSLAHDAYVFDFVSVCTLVPEVVSDATGRPLDLSSVVVQGGSSTAVAGIVSFPAVAVTARVGTMVRGRVDCSTGGLLSPEPALTWAIAMAACPLGSAPAGNGASCINCGRAYSDGGPSARACITCPTFGAGCSGGVLNLLPGFYRADSNPTIDEHTELHPCPLPLACWVNTTTANRSAAETHGCNEGYSGVLCGVCAPGYARTGKKCGVCSPPAFNWFATALIPAAVLTFGAWAAKRSINEASPFAPLTRVVLGHVQLLGALMGTFIAQGTGLVREMLGFTEVVGDSPLAIAPVQCALGGLTLYTRFFTTLALVPALMAATLGAQAVLYYRRRRAAARKARKHAASRTAGEPYVVGTRLAAATATATAVAAPTAPIALRSDSAMAESVVNPLRTQRADAASLDNGSNLAQSNTALTPHLAAGLQLQPSTELAVLRPARGAVRANSCAACTLRVQRVLDDPRITGPAAFVLVSAGMLAHSCRRRS